MPVYNVTRKVDGAAVYRYVSDAPIEWTGMEFSTHDHVEQQGAEAAPQVMQPRRMTKLQFIGLMTQPEVTALLEAAKADVDVELFVKMLDWVTVEADGTSVDRDDPRTIAGVRALFSDERADEILGVVHG